MTDEVEQRIRKRLVEVAKAAPRKVGLFEKAFSGRSKLAAMRAKCLDCCGLSSAEVKRCTVCSCPLWKYR